MTELTAANRMVPGEICWTDLNAMDLDAQTTFYESMFGWTHYDMPTDMGPIYRLFQLEGLVVAGASQMSPELMQGGMPAMWNLYIATTDADASAARATSLGGQVIMPAMDVMDQGRMVGITDPTGGAIFFWQAGVHKGADVFGVPGSLMWADLSTTDPGKAAAFYTDLAGWTVEAMTGNEMPYWQASVAGVPEGGIMPMPPGLPPGVPPNWLPYFGVVDVAAAVETATALGATIEAPPMEAAGVAFAVLSDPAGGTFSIMEPVS